MAAAAARRRFSPTRLCGGHMEASADKLEQLNHALVAFEQEAGDAFEIPAAFEREMQRVSADVNEGRKN